MLFRNHRRLSGDFEAFAAAHVFAGHHVVFADHVGAGFGEAGAIAFVGASGKLALLSAHHPGDFILGGLMAMRTVQRGRFFFLTFIEKFTFFHKPSLVVSRSSANWSPDLKLIITVL